MPATQGEQREPLLVAIVGPTGAGKTALSLALAEKFAGEIVNCDSIALYREFEIGTAKPSAAELARAPHHLFNILEPTASSTAGTSTAAVSVTVRRVARRAARAP